MSVTFIVGLFNCTMSFEGGRLLTVWSPHMPKKLDAAELVQYRNGRNNFLAKLSAQIGGQVLVVEC